MGAIDDLYEEQFSDREARRELYSDYYSALRKVKKEKVGNSQEQERKENQ